MFPVPGTWSHSKELPIRCFECDEYGHIIMDCPHKIPPLGIPAKHHQPRPHRSHHARSGPRHCFGDRDRWSCSSSQPCYHRHHSSSCHVPYRGHHDIGMIVIITGVAHNAPIPHTGVIAINPIMTLHIDHTADHPHTDLIVPLQR